jgi:hypothetical protein
MREQNRLLGRPLPRRAVGSTLLLKGLEADVAVVLNAHRLNSRNLYVAITRCSRMITVCSGAHRGLAQSEQRFRDQYAGLHPVLRQSTRPSDLAVDFERSTEIQPLEARIESRQSQLRDASRSPNQAPHDHQAYRIAQPCVDEAEFTARVCTYD